VHRAGFIHSPTRQPIALAFDVCWRPVIRALDIAEFVAIIGKQAKFKIDHPQRRITHERRKLSSERKWREKNERRKRAPDASDASTPLGIKKSRHNTTA
jgi:hypothetical protein